MKCLLIEDDENKRSQLQSYLGSRFPDIDLQLARSLQAGVRRVRSMQFDLVLLDMTLPNYDPSPDEPGGGTIYSFGGREFLKQIDRFNIKVPVIVVTQFETFGQPPQTTNLEELDDALRSSFADTYCGSVYYHPAIEGWQRNLSALIEEITGLREHGR